jgi:hypothetical protein
MAVAERSHAAKLRAEANQLRAGAGRERGDLADQAVGDLPEITRNLAEAVKRAHAARSQAQFLCSMARDRIEQAAMILRDSQALRR